MDMSKVTYNDLFYTGSLIEYIGRETKNRRCDVAKKIGVDGFRRLLYLAEVNHCLSFEQVGEETVEEFGITNGTFDTVSSCKYKVPRFKDIGAVYARLVFQTEPDPEKYPQAMYDVFMSEISDCISDFNSAWFYTPSNQLAVEYMEDFRKNESRVEK